VPGQWSSYRQRIVDRQLFTATNTAAVNLKTARVMVNSTWLN